MRNVQGEQTTMNLLDKCLLFILAVTVLWVLWELYIEWAREQEKRDRREAIQEQLDFLDPWMRVLTLKEMDDRRALLRELEELT
jgi:hypothetical protein